MSRVSDFLSSCPFCGSRDVGLHETRDDCPHAFAQCQQCGAQGPVEGALYDALSAWNKRVRQMSDTERQSASTL